MSQDIYFIFILLLVILLIALLMYKLMYKLYSIVNLTNMNVARLFKQFIGSGEMPKTVSTGFKNPQGHKLTYDIIDGRKTVEGRTKSGQFATLNPGDTLILKEKDVHITCEVTGIREYDNVTDYVVGETVERTIPRARSVEEAVDVYVQSFHVDKNAKFLGIGIKPARIEWQSSLKQPHFDNIANGIKTSEGRLFVGKWKHIQGGQFITFTHGDYGNNNTKQITKQITYVKKYPDFKSMLEGEGVDKVLPGMTIEDGLSQIYHKYYDPADAKKHGVVALGF